MKDETNKFLVEKLFGGCWHENMPEMIAPDSHQICKKCGKAFAGSTVRNPNLYTWQGFGWLWEKLFETDLWEKFFEWYEEDGWDRVWSADDDFRIKPNELIDPATFATRVREFMEGRE